MGEADLKEQDNPHLIQLYRKALSPHLSTKILYSKNTPDKLEDWFKMAAKFDRIYREANELIKEERSNPKYGFRNAYKRYDNKPRHDPNAMDIDAMSFEERSDLMRKGACFGCKKPGHLSRDCPEKRPYCTYKDANKDKGNVTQKGNYTPKKMGYKEVHAHIRALTLEERDKLFDLAKEDDGEKGEAEKGF